MGHHSNIVGGKRLGPKTHLEKKRHSWSENRGRQWETISPGNNINKGLSRVLEKNKGLWGNGPLGKWKFENRLCLCLILSKAGQTITVKKWDRNGSVEVFLEACAHRRVWEPWKQLRLDPHLLDLPHLLGWRLHWSQERTSQYGTITYRSSWKLPGTEETFNSQILTNWRRLGLLCLKHWGQKPLTEMYM